MKTKSLSPTWCSVALVPTRWSPTSDGEVAGASVAPGSVPWIPSAPLEPTEKGPSSTRGPSSRDFEFVDSETSVTLRHAGSALTEVGRPGLKYKVRSELDVSAKRNVTVGYGSWEKKKLR